MTVKLYGDYLHGLLILVSWGFMSHLGFLQGKSPSPQPCPTTSSGLTRSWDPTALGTVLGEDATDPTPKKASTRDDVTVTKWEGGWGAALIPHCVSSPVRIPKGWPPKAFLLAQLRLSPQQRLRLCQIRPFIQTNWSGTSTEKKR